MNEDSSLSNISVSTGLAIGALIASKIAAGFLNKFSLNQQIVDLQE